MKWTRAQFNALAEDERTDWLAYDARLQRQKLDMLRDMRRMIDEGKSPDGAAYMMVWLSLLEA